MLHRLALALAQLAILWLDQVSAQCNYTGANGYQLSWQYDPTNEFVTFDLLAGGPEGAQNYWTGVAFGESMADLDVIALLVNGNDVRLLDAFTQGYGPPTPDAQIDARLIDSSTINGGLSATFVRPLVPDDRTDKPLDDCVTFVFAESGGPLLDGDRVGKHVNTPVLKQICDVQSCVPPTTTPSPTTTTQSTARPGPGPTQSPNAIDGRPPAPTGPVGYGFPIPSRIEILTRYPDYQIVERIVNQRALAKRDQRDRGSGSGSVRKTLDVGPDRLGVLESEDTDTFFGITETDFDGTGDVQTDDVNGAPLDLDNYDFSKYDGFDLPADLGVDIDGLGDELSGAHLSGGDPNVRLDEDEKQSTEKETTTVDGDSPPKKKTDENFYGSKEEQQLLPLSGVDLDNFYPDFEYPNFGGTELGAFAVDENPADGGETDKKVTDGDALAGTDPLEPVVDEKKSDESSDTDFAVPDLPDYGFPEADLGSDPDDYPELPDFPEDTFPEEDTFTFGSESPTDEDLFGPSDVSGPSLEPAVPDETGSTDPTDEPGLVPLSKPTTEENLEDLFSEFGDFDVTEPTTTTPEPSLGLSPSPSPPPETTTTVATTTTTTPTTTTEQPTTRPTQPPAPAVSDGRRRCLARRAAVTEFNVNAHKPECNDNGDFVSRQCSDSECWCVFSDSGVEVFGTRTTDIDIECDPLQIGPDPCSSNPCPSGQICSSEPKQCITTPCPQFKCELQDGVRIPGCPAEPDIDICEKYFTDYFARVDTWSRLHDVQPESQYPRACKMIAAVPGVKNLCCVSLSTKCGAHGNFIS